MKQTQPKDKGGEVTNELGDIVDHLAAKAQNISLRSWKRPKSLLKVKGIYDLHLSEHHIQYIQRRIYSLFW